jgi:hypothetical protein
MIKRQHGIDEMTPAMRVTTKELIDNDWKNGGWSAPQLHILGVRMPPTDQSRLGPDPQYLWPRGLPALPAKR